jgi:uncharacterized protein
MGSVLVAYSGGVDSTFLVKVAADVLGPRAIAATARSASYPAQELEDASAVARQIGIRHMVIDTHETEQEAYLSNPTNRCYHCKVELWSTLEPVAHELGIAVLADGFNVDDEGDIRPGAKAGREAGARSPLREAGLTKLEVRQLSRQLGLPTWDKPPMACLSSRVPYGERISLDKLQRIDRAEQMLRELGFRQVRVRHHDGQVGPGSIGGRRDETTGTVARIELPPEDIGRFFAEGLAEPVSKRLKDLGFQYVTVDLEGYRSGSLNEVLTLRPV